MIKVVFKVFALLVILVVIQTTDSFAQIENRGFKLEFVERTYDSNVNKTFFTYSVTVPSTTMPGLFYAATIGLPTCTPTLVYPSVDRSDPNRSEINFSPQINRTGATWYRILDESANAVNLLKFSIEGDIPVGPTVGSFTIKNALNVDGIQGPVCPSMNGTDSPITPIADCITPLGNNQYLAFFGYLNTSSQTINIPAGSLGGQNENYLESSINSQIQPGTFLPGRSAYTFGSVFTGINLDWFVQYQGRGRVIASAHEDCTILCPTVVPTFSCVEELGDGQYRAHLGYNNPGSPLNVPIGEANKFSPGNINQGQPTQFSTGDIKDAFTVDFNGSPLTWTLFGNATGAVTVSADSPRCGVQPVFECVNNCGNGSATAQFGYVNPSSISVNVPVGSENSFSPSPEDRGQPTTFLSGSHSNVLQIPFNTPSLTWNLTGNVAEANLNSERFCQNNPPSCSASVTGSCQFDGSTLFTLIGAGNDPSGCGTTFNWSSNCAATVIADPSSSQTTASATGLASGTVCDFTLTCSGASSSTAEASGQVESCISVTPTPIVPEGTPTPCSNTDVSDKLFALDGNANRLKDIVKGITQSIPKQIVRKNKSIKKQINSLRSQSDKEAVIAWTVTWQIPRTILTCSESTTSCQEVSIATNFSTYKNSLLKLRGFVDKAVSISMKAKRSAITKREKQLRKNADALLKSSDNLLGSLPKSNYVCPESKDT